MGIIAWIVVGAIAGFIATFIMASPRDRRVTIIPSITDWRVGMRFQGTGGSRMPLVIIAVVVLLVAAVLIYLNFIV